MLHKGQILSLFVKKYVQWYSFFVFLFLSNNDFPSYHAKGIFFQFLCDNVCNEKLKIEKEIIYEKEFAQFLVKAHNVTFLQKYGHQIYFFPQGFCGEKNCIFGISRVDLVNKIFFSKLNSQKKNFNFM